MAEGLHTYDRIRSRAIAIAAGSLLTLTVPFSTSALSPEITQRLNEVRSHRGIKPIEQLTDNDLYGDVSQRKAYDLITSESHERARKNAYDLLDTHVESWEARSTHTKISQPDLGEVAPTWNDRSSYGTILRNKTTAVTDDEAPVWDDELSNADINADIHTPEQIALFSAPEQTALFNDAYGSPECPGGYCLAPASTEAQLHDAPIWRSQLAPESAKGPSTPAVLQHLPDTQDANKEPTMYIYEKEKSWVPSGFELVNSTSRLSGTPSMLLASSIAGTYLPHGRTTIPQLSSQIATPLQSAFIPIHSLHSIDTLEETPHHSGDQTNESKDIASLVESISSRISTFYTEPKVGAESTVRNFRAFDPSKLGTRHYLLRAARSVATQGHRGTPIFLVKPTHNADQNTAALKYQTELLELSFLHSLATKDTLTTKGTFTTNTEAAVQTVMEMLAKQRVFSTASLKKSFREQVTERAKQIIGGYHE